MGCRDQFQHMEQAVNRRDTDREREDAIAELAPLTDKQREVLVLCLKGYCVKETAKFLDVGTSTIACHRSAITTALGMSLYEAAVLAVRARWV